MCVLALNCEFVQQMTDRDRKNGSARDPKYTRCACIDELRPLTRELSMADPGAMSAEESPLPRFFCHQHGHRMCECPQKMLGRSRSKKSKKEMLVAGKRGDEQHKWGSYHSTKTHSDEECEAQQQKKLRLPGAQTLPTSAYWTQQLSRRRAASLYLRLARNFRPYRRNPPSLPSPLATLPDLPKGITGLFGAFGEGSTFVTTLASTETAANDNILTLLVNSGVSGNDVDSNLLVYVLNRVPHSLGACNEDAVQAAIQQGNGSFYGSCNRRPCICAHRGPHEESGGQGGRRGFTAAARTSTPPASTTRGQLPD